MPTRTVKRFEITLPTSRVYSTDREVAAAAEAVDACRKAEEVAATYCGDARGR